MRPLAMATIGAWAVALWGAAAIAIAGGAPSSLALCVAGAFVPYALIVATEQKLETRTLVALALVVGLPMVAAPVGLSDDVYRYLWDAHVLRSGTDPYLYAPVDPALHSLRDELWRQVNHPEIPTIYPPLAQAVFALADSIAHAPWSLGLLMLAAHVGLIPVLRRHGPPWAATAWALNPLALEESALGGHIDVLVGGALLAFVLALRARRLGYASLLVLAASGLKLVGIVLAPLVGRHRRLLMVPVLLLAALPVLPLVGAGSGSEAVGGLGQYARKWRGNEGLYALVEGSVAAGLAQSGEVSPGRVRFDSLRPIFERLEGTVLDPRASFLPEKKPIGDVAEFELHVLSAVLSRAMIALGVLFFAFTLAWRRVPPLLAGRWVLWAVLLLTPQIHPWYLLWLLPIEVAAGRVAGLVWSAVILVAYAPLDGWMLHREWQEAGGLFQHALVILVLLGEAWLSRTALAAAIQRGSSDEGSQSASTVTRERELSPKAV